MSWRVQVLALLPIAFLAAGCTGQPESAPALAPAAELNIYDWDGDIPESLQETGYAVPNDAAVALLPAEIRTDRSLFPLEDDLHKAEPLLAASLAAEPLQQRAMERIAAAIPRKLSARGEDAR